MIRQPLHPRRFEVFRTVLPISLTVLVTLTALVVCGGFWSAEVSEAAEATAQAPPPLGKSEIQGGLAVWVGDGNKGPVAWAQRLSDLHDQNGLLVLGLHDEREVVDETRLELTKLGSCGPVTVDRLSRQSSAAGLPLIDNSVNLLVIASGARSKSKPSCPLEEIHRVLAPRGVAWVNGSDGDGNSGGWQKIVEPWPADIDTWTHYLHDASNNAVAHDQQVGPPRHMQWQSGPRWGRHHDHMSSVSAVVSDQGRIFSIIDEGSRVSPQLPPDWKLVARDAFNGALLWKRPIDAWHMNLWPLKSGPASLPRRLVAGGDVVHATLGIKAPVAALDAASGKTLRTYADTAGAEEILRQDGTLLVLVNRTPVDLDADLAVDVEEGRSRDSRTTYSPTMQRIWAGIRSRRWTHGDRVIRAFDADTGQPLWEKAGRIIPLTLAADGRLAYFHDGEKVVALELATGKPRWESESVPVWEGLEGQGLQSWFAPTLVVADGQVLFAGGEKTHMSYMGWGSKDIGQDTMTAFSAESGKKLWTANHPYSGYNSPEDLFVARGKVWNGVTAQGGPDGRYIGHDFASGQIADEFPPTVDAHWFHHRCHRAKATDKYILSSRTGTELIDLETGQWTTHHWVRGGCLYGLMPANGLIYFPLHPCSCYAEAKLNGFTALAAGTPSRQVPEAVSPEGRLERGPAYEGPFPSADEDGKENGDEKERKSDWPTYRHNPARSSANPIEISAQLEKQWELPLGTRLTQPIVADGRLFVADIDRHAIHAVDAASGKKLWTHVADGRIDSPPTYDRGRLLFGSAGGYVHCLRASDGAVAWRFRAAPIDRRLVAFDQVESAWPVPGSILVDNKVATLVAGRSMYLDGGLRFCRLDVDTGQLLTEKIFDDRDPETGENMRVHIKGLDMAVALPDILASDGQRLYMRRQAMDLEGNRQELAPGSGRHEHLFAPYGFTDGSYFHRVYWLFGSDFKSGIGGYRNGLSRPGGRILVNNDSTVFGYGRKPEYYRWSSVLDCQLFAAVKPGTSQGSPQAIYFDHAPSLDPSGKPITVAAWLRTDAQNGTVLVRGASKEGFALVLTAGKPRMLLRTKETTHDVTAATRIGTDWTHVAGVLREDGRMEIHVNGELAGSTEGVPTLGSDPLIPMKVGYDDTNQLLPKPLVPFDGVMDEVMLYHRALSLDEIKRLAQRQSTQQPKQQAKQTEADREGLVLHLAFSGGKIRDGSPCGNHGKSNDARFKTVEGPLGDALCFEQPEKPVVPKAKRTKGSVNHLWTRDIPMVVRAMALSKGTLWIAGPADLVDEDATFQDFYDVAVQKQLALQDAALKGQSGATFQAVDAATGETLAEYTLDSPPVFDGMIVADGRVFVATLDGQVTAFAEAREQ